MTNDRPTWSRVRVQVWHISEHHRRTIVGFICWAVRDIASWAGNARKSIYRSLSLWLSIYFSYRYALDLRGAFPGVTYLVQFDGLLIAWIWQGALCTSLNNGICLNDLLIIPNLFLFLILFPFKHTHTFSGPSSDTKGAVLSNKSKYWHMCVQVKTFLKRWKLIVFEHRINSVKLNSLDLQCFHPAIWYNVVWRRATYITLFSPSSHSKGFLITYTCAAQNSLHVKHSVFAFKWRTAAYNIMCNDNIHYMKT